MSIAIYNGYKLPERLTMDSIFDWLPEVKKVMRSAALEAMARHVETKALHLYDKEVAAAHGIAVKGDLLGSHVSPFVEARSFLFNQLRETQRERARNHLDPDTSLCVFRSTQGLFALLYSCSKEIKSAFESVEGVEQYFYYNNVDKPEEISEEEWESRGKLWDEMIGETGVPAENSATFQIISADFFFLEELPKSIGNLAEQISLSERAKRVAMATEASELPKEEAEVASKGNDLAPYMAHIRRLERGESPVFNAERDRIQALLAEKVMWTEIYQSASEIRLGLSRRCPRQR